MNKSPSLLYNVRGMYSSKRKNKPGIVATRAFNIMGAMEPVVGEGLGSFVNDPKGTGLEANCEFVTTDDNQIAVKTLEKIKRGTELLISYGDDWWRDYPDFTNA